MLFRNIALELNPAKRKTEPKKRLRTSKLKRRQALIGIAYALPALLLLVLFRYWPLLFGTWISLWKWGFVPEQFIGLGNYVRIFTEDLIYKDPTFGWQLGPIGQSLLVTLYYAIGTIPPAIMISFFIAYYLFQQRKGMGALRTIFFLPYITSQVAAALVFKWIFHPSVGVANGALERFGLPKQEWLGDPDPVGMKLVTAFGGTWPEWLPAQLGGPTYALIVIMIFTIWNSIGFNIVIFLAGLGNVPADLYEAAKIDGARTVHLMRHVTLPLLSPMLFLLTIVSVIGAFESFNTFYVFSGGEGGPLGTTMSLPLYIFRSFYVYGQVGYAAAVSMVLFTIVLTLTWIQYRFGEKKVHYQH
ncbi:carbohydrate ABC transporter permease [Paenibacillus turpanensis]|uniref:carbohydrate ABC transporter permease n=1 Tax=Paenibacillus turpanensis TaxID=2689078 RepID=UPI00140AA6E3|nr:sugar ABC transporter permease [Paenibacillus turpanensis]